MLKDSAGEASGISPTAGIRADRQMGHARQCMEMTAYTGDFRQQEGYAK